MHAVKWVNRAAAVVLAVGAGALVATPAYAASVTVTIDGITYEADDSDVAAGATAVSYDFSDPVVTIPDTVTIGATGFDVLTIGVGAFNGEDPSLPAITDVTIGDNVTVIGRRAFSAHSISNLVLGSAVQSIDGAAFWANALTEVTFPESLDFLGTNSFSFNTNLTSVVFTGPAPAQIAEYDHDGPSPWSGTFDVVPGFVISFPEAYSAHHVADGYTAPEWKRYPTQAMADDVPDTEVSITKTVDASFVRVYDWELTKSGTIGEITIGDDDASADVDFTVTAAPAGYTDSYFVLSGEITVTNETVEPKHVTVTDEPEIGIDASCTVETSAGDPASDLRLAGNESASLAYFCSLGAEPEDGINTATVSWGDDSSSSVTEDVEFTQRATSFENITVGDDHADPAGGFSDLGPATWSSDRLPYVFEYTTTLENLHLGECTSVTNTAIIYEMERTAAATVEICPQPAPVTADPEPTPESEITPAADPNPAGLAQTGTEFAGGGLAAAVLLLLVGSTALMASRRTRHAAEASRRGSDR